MKLTGILLAGGRGARFAAAGGRGNKLLTPLAHGLPVAVQSLATLQAGLRLSAAPGLDPALPEVVAVIRPGEPELAAALAAQGARLCITPAACEGMGASLAAAAASVGDDAAVVIALADMPWLRASTIAEVCRALAAGAELAQPWFRGQGGHPVGLRPAALPALRALGGDQGARAILRAQADRLQRIETDDAGCVRDVDSPEDLTAARGG